jgi:hypothetical protein
MISKGNPDSIIRRFWRDLKPMTFEKFNSTSLAGASALLAITCLCMPVTMHAGTIILEGSDAIGYHCPGGNASACTYESQTWKALSGGSTTVPIAIIGQDASGTTGHVGIQTGSNTFGMTLDQFATVAAAAAAGSGLLSQYGAIYFLATGGCCTENDTLIPTGEQAAITAYLAGGGTVMIENYIGGTAWSFAVDPGSPLTNLNPFVAGVGGGQSSSLNCDDGETVTALGIANGFTQPTTMNCWTHQAYDQSVFTPLGFTESFFTSPADGGYSGTGPYSSLLSSGNTVTGGPGTPEPASMLTMCTGLLGLGAVLRRRKAARK